MKKLSWSTGQTVGRCYLSSSMGSGQGASAASSLCQSISCKLLIWHIPHDLCPLKAVLDSVPDPSSYIMCYFQILIFFIRNKLAETKAELFLAAQQAQTVDTVVPASMYSSTGGKCQHTAKLTVVLMLCPKDPFPSHLGEVCQRTMWQPQAFTSREIPLRAWASTDVSREEKELA